MSLTTRKCVEFSTQHVSEDDSVLLHAMAGDEDAPISVAEYEYGYFINLYDIDFFDEQLAGDLARAGMSEAFVKVMRAAIAEGANVLNLDRDGEQYDEFQKFDW